MSRRQYLTFAACVAVAIAMLVVAYKFRMAEFEAGVRPAQYPGDPNAYRLKD